MKYLFIVFLLLFIIGCGNIITTKSKIEKAMEYGFFQGQLKAVQGDIRIIKIDSLHWNWKKSPWDDGSIPSYNPMQSDSLNFSN